MIKSAKDWFEEELSGEPLTQESVIECIRMVQEDVIRNTVEECAQSAKLVECDPMEFYVDKQSILSVADKLIKEL